MMAPTDNPSPRMCTVSTMGNGHSLSRSQTLKAESLSHSKRLISSIYRVRAPRAASGRSQVARYSALEPGEQRQRIVALHLLKLLCAKDAALIQALDVIGHRACRII